MMRRRSNIVKSTQEKVMTNGVIDQVKFDSYVEELAQFHFNTKAAFKREFSTIEEAREFAKKQVLSDLE